MGRWIALIVLVGALIAANSIIGNLKTDDEHEHAAQTAKPKKLAGKATLEPGRVVTLRTSRGEISFVLFEKDVPKTSKRIADLVGRGRYDGVLFERVEDWVIQTGECKKETPRPMNIEVIDGLVHAKGAVGMARSADYKSNTSVFYIVTEPQPYLDGEYTVFGRVISGMDVAMKIKIGDPIVSAQVRPMTPDDRKKFDEALRLESDRKTQ